jgi:mannose-6-phosphate isomerase-like protein (cupin superfamily)
MPGKIAYVLTVGFGASDEAPIQIALDEVLRLAPFRVIVVHDRKGRSGVCTAAAVESRRAAFAAVGAPLEVVPVDQDETTLRWRAGVVERAFDDPAVETVFVFATDFDKLPTDAAREGWLRMTRAAASNTLVLGDYQPKPGSFKDEFHKLVAKPAVEAVFPEQGAALLEAGVRQFRTEFFILGRSVLDRLRRDAIMWTMDPTTDMALACLRAGDLTLEVVDLGSFEDRADTRDPLGELFQVTRYVFQLVINLIRLKRSAGLSRADQIRVYEDLIPVIDKAVEVGRYAVRRNLERLKENPKLAAFQPEAPWQEQWVPARFHGFSYLLDNPGNSLVTSEEGVPLLSCDVSPSAQRDLALYRRLAAVLQRLEPRLREFCFCPLCAASFHVTFWDGINQNNAASLPMTKRAEFEAFARALPASVAGPASPILPPPVVSLGRRWTVRLKFKELHIWAEPAVLVALLEPADEKSKAAMELLDRHRRDLDVHYTALGKPPNPPWTPHVSCGYFKTSEDASAAKRHLSAWTDLVMAELADQSIEFSSASLYSFSSMERFYRHPLPAVIVALRVIKMAIAERTGFIGEEGGQKILITYQYGTREQLATVSWQPLARSGNKHYCVTPHGLDLAVVDHRAKQDRHYHRGTLELYRVLEGTLTMWVGNVKHTIQAGEEIIVAPYAVHEVVSETPFIAAVIVATATGTADKFPSATWTVPGCFATPALQFRPTAVSLGESGLQELFQGGPGVHLAAFDELWNGETDDNSKPATRVFTVLAGSMTVDVNHESYDLNAGDTMVVFPLTIYRLSSSGPFLAEVLTLNCS